MNACAFRYGAARRFPANRLCTLATAHRGVSLRTGQSPATPLTHRLWNRGNATVAMAKPANSSSIASPTPKIAISPPKAPQPASQLLPEHAARSVGWWMTGLSGLVFGIVVLGGLTRLTESGLSMVDWSFAGTPPPLNEQEWQAYFEKYQLFPEYQLTNKGMTLAEFKRIYWYEYSHRMLGRVIGVTFLLPAVYFAARGKFYSASIKKRVVAIGTLIVGQGLMGWYMVKSGLSQEIVEKQMVPRVSQYRLASHLGLAFTIYTLTLATALQVLVRRVPALPAQFNTAHVRQQLAKLRGSIHGVAGMIFITALSGAFVAGLDAGLVYNTFPKMADRWIPSDLLAFTPAWINIFENPTTVQFNHRILAMSTYTAIVALWLWSRRLTHLPPHIRNSLNAMLLIGSAQVTLGVSTLLWLVPIELASAHQAGSLTLLTSAIWAMKALKRVPK